jgi:hypothetical protein
VTSLDSYEGGHLLFVEDPSNPTLRHSGMLRPVLSEMERTCNRSWILRPAPNDDVVGVGSDGGVAKRHDLALRSLY